MRREDLGHKMRVGALWTYLQMGIGAVWRFGTGVILARILNPADFGVFAAVSAFTAILSQQVMFGLAASLLQAKKVEERQWNSAFWFMEGVALAATAIAFAISGWLQSFFDDPHYSTVMRLMCVNFFIIPYNTINRSLLRREMKYKTISQITLSVGLFSPWVGIAAAVAGWGPYSLVAGGISSATLLTIFMARKAPWRPYLSFSFAALRPLLTNAWQYHLNNTLNWTANRVDNILVGKITGIQALGLYNKAFSLARLPLEEVTIRLYQILFTGLSRVKGDDAHTISMYQKALCALASATYPMLLLLVLLGEGLVVDLYGVKWAGAVLPMQIMAIGAFAGVLSITLGALSDAQGLMLRETPIEVSNILMTIVAVAVGSHWGLVGVATGIALKAVARLLLMQRLLNTSNLRLRWAQLVRPVWPAVSATLAGAMASVVVMYHLAQHYSPRHILFIGGVGGVALTVYGAVWLGCARLATGNEAVQTIMEMVRSGIRRILSRERRPTAGEGTA
jgi:O-antigen/teichoic acid export membrane protein